LVTKQGYHCTVCKYPAHKQCYKLVPPNCGHVKHFLQPQLSMKSLQDQVISNSELFETLQDEASCERFRVFLGTQPVGIMQLTFWLECEEFKLLATAEQRNDRGRDIYDLFFALTQQQQQQRPTWQAYDFDFNEKICKEVESASKAKRFETTTFNAAQVTVYEQMQLIFPIFAKLEFQKRFTALPGEQVQIAIPSPAPTNLTLNKDKRTADKKTTPTPAPNATTNTSTSPTTTATTTTITTNNNNASDEEGQKYGTFVLTNVVSNEAAHLPEVHQSEIWESNILALEKGEWSSDMSPLAFKKYVHTRARLPSFRYNGGEAPPLAKLLGLHTSQLVLDDNYQ